MSITSPEVQMVTKYENEMRTHTRYWINRNLDQYIKRFCSTTGAKILDLGCGDGIYSLAFKKAGIKGSYLGIDLYAFDSWNVIKAFKPHGLYCEFRVLDAQRLQELNRKFDFIIIVTALEYIENYKDAMKGVKQVLEPNGRVLIIVTSRSALLFHNVGRLTLDSVASFKHLLLNTGLEIEETVKVSGIFSFLFQTVWFGITFFIARGLRLIVYLFFLGKKQKAKQRFPRMIHTISQLRYLHLKTKLGRMIQKRLYNILNKLDRLLPYCPSAHLFILH